MEWASTMAMGLEEGRMDDQPILGDAQPTFKAEIRLVLGGTMASHSERGVVNQGATSIQDPGVGKT